MLINLLAVKGCKASDLRIPEATREGMQLEILNTIL